ncbi:MAG: four helix bundle protein [Bacteroidota bacterium]
MTSKELISRFKAFAINVALIIKSLPKDSINLVYSNQLIRSSSSAGANYRAACRAKSTADFINKLKIVEEELDETIFFLELLAHFNSGFKEKIILILNEGNELLAITVQSIKTSRIKQKVNN